MEEKDIITCLKKIRKKLKEYQKTIGRLKNILHKCKRVSKSVLQIYIFFVLLLIFKG